MSSFSVNTDKLKETDASFDAITGRIRNYSDDVKSTKDILNNCFGGQSASLVLTRLGNISEDLLDRAARMESLGSALRMINEEYIRTENLLLGNTGESFSDSNDSTEERSRGTDKRNWWQKFWDWLFHKDIDEKYTHTSIEEEEAADREMQAAIQNLLNSDERFSEEYWKNASVEERKQILTDFMNKVKSILGLDFLPATINWTNKPPQNGTVNMGSYSDGSKTVSINEWVIRNRSDSYRLMTTIVHELRHGYQHAAIANPTNYRVSKETIDAWRESFRTYKSEKAKGYEAYRNIVVERDARSFAGQD